ncbi:MAG: ATP-binding protein [Lachnospiraceae bacterium]|nr:ATP-binding protein [Lachnospiraceae bacterium]
MIERKKYLDMLIRKKENGMVKVITGIRRCGKSYLLFDIYHKYLNSVGVDDSHIIELALDDDENIRWRNPIELGKHIRELMTDKERMYYIFLDEIQKVAEIPNPYLPGTDETVGFVDVVLGLMKIKNADVYVTGSNSKMLSSDILTEFRGRGDEIRVNPLSFSEFYNAYTGDKHDAWQEYFTYGGMPLVMLQKTHEDKAAYLRDLFDKIYLDDIITRKSIGHAKSVLEDLLDVISSSVGSLTNPLKLSNTFASVKKMSITDDTIAKYLDYFIDAFLLYKAQRFDVKGRKYIGSPLKYYFSDIGLRNARLNFRQQEENHIMENIIYNELRYRDYSVDVGIVEYNHKNAERKSVRSQLEIDFVANNGSDKLYIQSALNVSDEEKRRQEVNSLKRINDSFRKIVVIKDNIIPWHDDDGIYYIGIEKFLLGKETGR